MARTRTRPTRQDTIDQLLEGARQAFVERGFYGARVEDICAKVGLSRGAFYSAFGRKEDLFFALYDRMAIEVRDLFAGSLNGVARGQDPIDALFGNLAGHYPLGRDWYVLNAEFTLFAIRHADAARILGEKRHALRTMIAQHLDVALQRSGRQAVIAPELLARALVGLADAGLGQSLIEPDALGPATFIDTFMPPLVRALSIQVLSPEAESSRPSGDSLPPSPKIGSLPTEAAVPDRLLAVAQSAFIRDGYDNARLSDIAKLAGVSKGTIYDHAPSKAALFEAAVRASIERLAEATGTGLVDGAEWRPALEHFLIAHIRLHLSSEAVGVYRLVLSQKMNFPQLMQLYVDCLYREPAKTLQNWLEIQVLPDDHVLRRMDKAASMLMDMVLAEPLRQIALGGAPEPGDHEIRERVDEALDMFCGR